MNSIVPLPYSPQRSIDLTSSLLTTSTLLILRSRLLAFSRPVVVWRIGHCLHALKPDAVRITAGAEHVGMYKKTPASERQYCKKCGGHLMANHPQFGLVDVFATTLPTLKFSPGVHVNYAETVLPIQPSISKFSLPGLVCDFVKREALTIVSNAGPISPVSSIAALGFRSLALWLLGSPEKALGIALPPLVPILNRQPSIAVVGTINSRRASRLIVSVVS